MTDAPQNSADLPPGLPAEVLGDLESLIAEMSEDRLFRVPAAEPPPEVQADVDRLVRDMDERRSTHDMFGSIAETSPDARQGPAAGAASRPDLTPASAGETSGERPVVSPSVDQSSTGGGTTPSDQELATSAAGATVDHRDLLAAVVPSARLGAEPRPAMTWLRHNWPFVLAGFFIALGVVLIVLVLGSA